LKKIGTLIRLIRNNNFIDLCKIILLILIQKIENQFTRIKIHQIDVSRLEYLFITHDWNLTGAPIIVADILDMNQEILMPNNTLVWSANKPANQHPFTKGKIEVRSGTSEQFAKIFTRFSFRIFLNSSAIPKDLLSFVFDKAVKDGSTKIFFYIHEDVVWDSSYKEIVQKIELLNRLGMIKVATTSEGTRIQWAQVFSFKLGIVSNPLPFQPIARSEDDFNNLNLHITGHTSDNRKNHFYAIDLLKFVLDFLENSSDIEKFRRINLKFYGCGSDPYSLNMLKVGKKVLGQMLDFDGLLSREDLFSKLSSEQNVVLCVSVFETLPLFVSESMFAGQVVLRNSCSGVKEQLSEGSDRNGFLLTGNVEIDSKIILRLLDRNMTSNLDLLKMSVNSTQIAVALHPPMKIIDVF
jgi:hypothetical protein